MINVKSWLISVVTTDPTLQALLTNTSTNPATQYNIFPMGVDLVPEQFPAITFSDAGVGLLMAPIGMRTGRFQVDIWSKINSLECETIYERLSQLVNYQHSRTATTPFPQGVLYWFLEQMVMDKVETTRRLWRKTVDYKVWFTNSTEAYQY